jgi:hypothetical protein
MTREMIDRLLDPAPQSTIDVDRIIAHERRRRWLGAGSAAGGVLAVVAATLVVAGAIGGVAPVSVAESTGSASPSVSTVDTATPTRLDIADPDATLERLRVALNDAMATVAPDASWRFMPVGGLPSGPDAPEMHVRTQTVSIRDSNGNPVDFDGNPVNPPAQSPGFSATAGISRGGKLAGFYLGLGPICRGVSCPPRQCDPPHVTCVESTTSGGLALTTITERWDGGYLFFRVLVQLPAGDYSLGLEAVNYFGGDASPVSAPEPLLSQQELATMAVAIVEELVG